MLMYGSLYMYVCSMYGAGFRVGGGGGGGGHQPNHVAWFLPATTTMLDFCMVERM